MEVPICPPSLIDELVTVELSLASAYERTLVGLAKGSLRSALRNLQRSHRQAAQLLSGRVDGDLGAPQGYAPAEPRSRLEPRLDFALLQSEEQRAGACYRAALATDGLNPGVRTLIETGLLPETQERIASLTLLSATIRESPALRERIAVA